MRAFSTPIGDVVVLPPCDCDDVDDPNYPCLKPAHKRVGDTVSVDEECPTCEGTGVLKLGNGSRHVPHRSCNYSGTVSVPYTVTEVLPIVAEHVATARYIIIDWAGTPWLVDRTQRTDDYPMPLHLPDPQPGGVALLVERAK